MRDGWSSDPNDYTTECRAIVDPQAAALASAGASAGSGWDGGGEGDGGGGDGGDAASGSARSDFAGLVLFSVLSSFSAASHVCVGISPSFEAKLAGGFVRCRRGEESRGLWCCADSCEFLLSLWAHSLNRVSLRV